MPAIKNILTKYPAQLSKISSTPKLDVEVLLSYAIKKPKEFLYTHPEYELNKKHLEKFNHFISRRLKNEPIAYITGEKEFYGLNFAVDKNVMIPSPETELLVDDAIKKIISICRSPLIGDCGGAVVLPRRSLSAEDCGAIAQEPPNPPPYQGGNENSPLTRGTRGVSPNQQTILIDIGTGSGCIPISIIKNLPKNINKKIQTYAIDISQKALTLAKKNARLHNVEKEIEFIKSDLLQIFSLRHSLSAEDCNAIAQEPPNPHYQGGDENSPLPRRGWGKVQPPFTLPPTPSAGGESANIIITANLPYISNSEYKKLSPDIKNYEPKNALIAGNDGLKYYRQLFKQIAKTKSDKITLIIEIDFKSMCPKAKFKKTIKQYLPNSNFKIKKDLGSAERVAVIQL